VALPPELDAGHVYHLFPVLSTDRPALQAHLSASGVETLIHYPVPIPRQPALAAARPRPCPVTDRICGQVLSLPLYPMLADADVRAIIAAVNALPAAANRRT